MRRMGSTETEIREALGDDEDSQFEIWPENAAAVDTFLALQTQWRVGPLGGYAGLDYPGVRTVMTLRGVKRKARDRMFREIQLMERAALEILNKRDA